TPAVSHRWSPNFAWRKDDERMRLPQLPRPYQYTGRRRGELSVRADGSRGSARYAPGSRRDRQQEVGQAFRPLAPAVRLVPEARFRFLRLDWQGRSRWASWMYARLLQARRLLPQALPRAGRRHAAS